ncbi:hypothetical protein EVAR_39818_1 [Eumeta japonica]|uniref:Uncharacterized protein n=1 Tax=Eumeta variegata TaxID=151549 RepID=A0A4C1X9U6_EUMVA|nr:hypothetical protein EVAR_39818_1 [Eumeta japonica]
MRTRRTTDKGPNRRTRAYEESDLPTSEREYKVSAEYFPESSRRGYSPSVFRIIVIKKKQNKSRESEMNGAKRSCAKPAEPAKAAAAPSVAPPVALTAAAASGQRARPAPLRRSPLAARKARTLPPRRERIFIERKC